MRFPRRTSACSLAATLLLGSACGERGPSSPSEPLLAPEPTAAFMLDPTMPINWDFVTLAGAPDRGLGDHHTFMQTGAGSVVASAGPVAFTDQFQVYSKNFAQPEGTEERGLGLCRQFAA